MNRLLLVVVLALTGGGMLWGFWTVGGPETARMEKRDDIRFAHLQQVGDHYKCVANGEPGEDQVVASDRCKRSKDKLPDLQDPLTGNAYRYSRTSAHRFEVCATFEVATGVSTRSRTRFFGLRGIVFDGHEGCKVYVRNDADSKWYNQP